jgi:hypothetical protein
VFADSLQYQEEKRQPRAESATAYLAPPKLLAAYWRGTEDDNARMVAYHLHPLHWSSRLDFSLSGRFRSIADTVGELHKRASNPINSAVLGHLLSLNLTELG